MIRTKLVIEIQLIIKKFPVGSLLSSWFSVITDLQVQRGSNKKAEKSFTIYSKKWLNNQRINLMNKAITYRPTS